MSRCKIATAVACAAGSESPIVNSDRNQIAHSSKAQAAYVMDFQLDSDLMCCESRLRCKLHQRESRQKRSPERLSSDVSALFSRQPIETTLSCSLEQLDLLLSSSRRELECVHEKTLLSRSSMTCLI